MEIRNVGRSGLLTSIVGLGCNNFAIRLDKGQSAQVVHAALDNGYTMFDTSVSYGSGVSEEFLGAALRTRRGNVVVATKFCSPMGEGPYVRGATGALHVTSAVSPSNAHLLGTARMGVDPATLVVNRWGLTHDIANLGIIDGSVFVTAGAVNPTSTIIALALRTAQHLLDQRGSVSRSGDDDAGTETFDVLALSAAGAYYIDARVRDAIGYPGKEPTPVSVDSFPDYVAEGLLEHMLA